MGKEILTLGNIETKKNKFSCHKSPAPGSNVNIDKVLVSNKIYSGENNSINTLLVACIMMIRLSRYIMLPKTSASVKSYDGQTKLIF